MGLCYGKEKKEGSSFCNNMTKTRDDSSISYNNAFCSNSSKHTEVPVLQKKMNPSLSDQEYRQSSSGDTRLNAQSNPQPLSHSDNLQENQQQASSASQTTNISLNDTIDETYLEVREILSRIQEFEGVSENKEYLMMDEMLTRCILKLDKVNCSNSDKLRQKRKAAINSVNTAISILERKLVMNSDMKQLAEKLSSD